MSDMAILNVPSIFWTTLLSVVVILILATIIGRAWGGLFPYRLRGNARFYLAPVLGLATLTIISSLLGRFLPLGNSVLVPVLVVSLMVWALVRERRAIQAFRHSMWVSIFGIVSGASVLAPLFAYGAFNAHNDGFTYLVHANWLQGHAFGDAITVEQVTPLTTQVSLYQQEGFRMGGSFLLALTQSLLNLKWSYEVYPAVVISAIAACCLAIGFPLAKSLLPIRRLTRLALLVLPAFTMGGLVFGANLGFLPQTVGLSTGAGLLFAVGPSFQWLSIYCPSGRVIAKAALPAAVLFSAAVFAYSELAPFLLVAVLGSGFILALHFRSWGRVIVYTGLLLVLSGLLLNTELIRAYTALQTQSGAIVGSPVDWSLLGYIAHTFGVHGGAWDGFQWTLPESSGSALFASGLVLMGLIGLVVLAGGRTLASATLSGALMPVAVVLIVFGAGLIYFRYFVPSPFTIGIGQSWSQFKLADWAHPFAITLVLLAIASLRPRLGKLFSSAVLAIFAVGLVSSLLIGVMRITPLIQYYGGERDLNRFYQDFRQTVLASCPSGAPVYLALNGQHHKFRQMAIYFLPDRVTTSDWMDDGYIFARLPVDRRTQALNSGDCVVEPVAQGSLLSKGATVGIFRIGVFDGQGQVRIASASGAYDRETDGINWWHWVERKVSFRLQPLHIPNEATQSKLQFEYSTRGKQILKVHIRTRDGSNRQFSLHSKDGTPARFEKIFDLPPSELTDVSIETDSLASRLGEQDARMAAWIIRNLSVTPLLP
jgi:hypothetical protein